MILLEYFHLSYQRYYKQKMKASTLFYNINTIFPGDFMVPPLIR